MGLLRVLCRCLHVPGRQGGSTYLSAESFSFTTHSVTHQFSAEAWEGQSHGLSALYMVPYIPRCLVPLIPGIWGHKYFVADSCQLPQVLLTPVGFKREWWYSLGFHLSYFQRNILTLKFSFKTRLLSFGVLANQGW